MPTIPCYRCGHPIILSPESGAGPDVCPNCGHNFAVGKSMPPPLPGSGKDGGRSGMSTGTASGLAVLLGTIAGFVKTSGAGGALEMGYNVGQGFGGGLVVMAISFVLAILAATICLIFGKPFRRTLNSTYCLFAIILASLTLASAVFVRVTGRSAEKTRQLEQTAAAMAKDVDAVEEAVRISVETGKPIELNLGPVGDQNTEAGKERLIMHMNIKAMAEMQNAYLKSLAETGFDTLLDPGRLSKDKGMKESREILAKGSTVLLEHRGRFEEYLRTFPEKVKNLPNSPAKDPGWFRGFQQSFQKNGQTAARMLDIESEIVGAAGEMIEILAASEGKWQVEEGQIMFEDDEDMEKFNTAVVKTQELAKKQEKIREESFSRGKAQLEKVAK